MDYESYSIAEARESISELTERVSESHERIVITKRGKPCAIVMHPDDLAAIEETISIMSDPEVVKDLTEAWAAGFDEAKELTKAQALALIKKQN